jgi:TonB family protein
MFTRLIESRRRRERSAGATTLSVIAHAAVIGFAVHLTAAEATPAPTPPEVIILAPPGPITTPSGGPKTGGATCDPCPPSLPRPPRIDVNIPIGEVPPGDPIEQPGFPVGPGIGTPPSTGGDPGAGGFTETPDEPARALPGNPRPEYPALLRNMRVEAVVAVQFVVDTAGRVEPSSITFATGTDGLLEVSVRRALLASRFVPARTRDRAVRMLVRQDFAFRLTR